MTVIINICYSDIWDVNLFIISARLFSILHVSNRLEGDEPLEKEVTRDPPPANAWVDILCAFGMQT